MIGPIISNKTKVDAPKQKSIKTSKYDLINFSLNAEMMIKIFTGK